MENKETQKPVIKNWTPGTVMAVWENKKENGDLYYSVSIQHKYKRGEEEVKETIHIFPDDLLFLAQLCNMTHIDLYKYRQNKKEIAKKDSPSFDDDYPV